MQRRAPAPLDPQSTARASARAIPGAELIEYDGSAHGLFAIEKERLIGDLVRFLGGTTAADQRSAIPMIQTA
ncbi:MAG: hypothetical protein ABIT68_05005 [Sphingomicrobium sp.]